MFLVFGTTTAAFSFVMWKRMPDTPADATFFTPSDREIMAERLRGGQGAGPRLWKQTQFLEALRDAKTWLWAAMIFCIS